MTSMLSYTCDVIVYWVYVLFLRSENSVSLKMPLRKLSDSDAEMLIELRKNERALWDVTFAIGLYYMAWL